MVTAPGLLECGSHCLDYCYLSLVDVWGQKVERRRYPPRQQHPHAWSDGDVRAVCRHHYYYYRLVGG